MVAVFHPARTTADNACAIAVTMVSSRDETEGKLRNSLLLAAYAGLVGLWGLSQACLVSSVARTVSY